MSESLDAVNPIYRQVYERVRHSIASGALKPGDRVPSARSLADQLSLARGTVDAAYSLLCGEGYLVAEGSRGTFVNPFLGAEAGRRAPPMANRWPSPAEPASPRSWRAPFCVGLPAIDLFPRAAWARLAARRCRLIGPEDFAYPPTGGDERLRRALASYLRVARGVDCDEEDVVITGGYQSALALIASLVLPPGGKVWAEDPGYRVSTEALAALGARVIPVPVDGDGLNVEAGVRTAPEARLAVVAPSNQFPTNVALSLERRLALLDWARQADAWIVEDDYDSEFYYSGRQLPALKSLDADSRVFYVGTFSKTIYPGLRLGYVVAPPSRARALRAAARLRHGGVSSLTQAIVADFIVSGDFARHLKRMRTAYRSRRSATLAALRARLGETFDFASDAVGLHLVGRMPAAADDLALVSRAWRAGYRPMALSRLSHAGAARGLVLGFTNIPEDRAVNLVDEFCGALGL